VKGQYLGKEVIAQKLKSIILEDNNDSAAKVAEEALKVGVNSLEAVNELMSAVRELGFIRQRTGLDRFNMGSSSDESYRWVSKNKDLKEL
jgi:hypothetical protein